MSELIIKKRQAVFVFRVEDIVYMEKNLRKIRLHAKMCGCEKYEQIEFYGRFSEIISQLDDRFMYCHRSYVITLLGTPTQIYILLPLIVPLLSYKEYQVQLYE